MVYSYQKKEKTLPTEEKLRFILGIPSNEFSLIKKRLLKADLLLVSEKGIFIPTVASDDLYVLDIHRAILGSAYIIPENGANTVLNLNIKDDFVTLESYISDKLGRIKVNQLLGS
jgi:hypothetical protein